MNPFYFGITHASGYTEEKGGNKYLAFDSTELLKKYNNVFNEIRDEIKTINGGKENDYEKDYMKIEFNSDDELPLNKPLKFHLMTITIRSVFEHVFEQEIVCIVKHTFVKDTSHKATLVASNIRV